MDLAENLEVFIKLSKHLECDEKRSRFDSESLTQDVVLIASQHSNSLLRKLAGDQAVLDETLSEGFIARGGSVLLCQPIIIRIRMPGW